MNEIIYGIVQVRSNFALEVWFSILKIFFLEITCCEGLNMDSRRESLS